MRGESYDFIKPVSVGHSQHRQTGLGGGRGKNKKYLQEIGS